MGRLQQAEVHLHQIGVQRQDHERAVHVSHADQHGDIGVEHDQRFADDAQAQQQLVEHALVGQNALPGIDAQQKRGPERQHHQHQQRGANRGPGAREKIGERVADQQAQQCGEQGKLQRGPVGLHIDGVA